jgi:hypothetical protein
MILYSLIKVPLAEIAQVSPLKNPKEGSNLGSLCGSCRCCLDSIRERGESWDSLAFVSLLSLF